MPHFTHQHGWLTALLAAALVVLCTPGGRPCLAHPHRIEPHQRWPIPTDDEREEAASLIGQLYAEEIAAADTPNKQASLARQLTDDALGTYDDPVARYELFAMVVELYVQMGRLQPALEMLDHLNESHAIDLHQRRAEAATAVVAGLKSATQLEQLQSTLDEIFEEALAAEHFPAAYEILSANITAADTFERAELIDTLERRQRRLDAAHLDWRAVQGALATLREDPVDPEANLELGRYHCFARGNWEEGIPYLALGSDANLRQAARLELNLVPASVELKRVADAWWECDFSASDPAIHATRQRAAFWYTIAAVELTGISKTTAERRAAEVGPIQDAYPLAGTRFMARSPALRPVASYGMGANYASELAVEEGLAWLANHQLFDGSWDCSFHGAQCMGSCEHASSFYAPAASTGLALLPLLAAGNTHQYGPYQENVAAGLAFLLENMQYHGNQGAFLDARGVFSHCVCTLAVAEAYLMTGDPALEEPLKDAIYFLEQNQDMSGGGWNVAPGGETEISITSWAVMALKTAEIAGLRIPQETMQGARYMSTPPEVRQLMEEARRAAGQNGEDASDADDSSTSPGRLPKADRLFPNDPRATAALQFSRIFLGWPRDNAYMIEGMAELAENPPQNTSLYYDFLVMQILRLYRDELWSRWHTEMRDQLVATQAQEGHASGSWYFPEDIGGTGSSPILYGDLGSAEGGRLNSTVMALLILQTYHRQSGLNL